MATPVRIKVLVTDATRHRDGLVSYRFKPEGRVPRFRPGQFLHLALDEYHPQSQWPESRVFSIASSPTERLDELAITISVKGRYTQRIFDELEVGSRCWLKLPYGNFLFPADRDLTLIAGGVGITPYISLLKQMLEERSGQCVSLYYGVRTMDDYLFGSLLASCVEHLPNFRLVVYSEKEGQNARCGILDIDVIAQEASTSTLFYLSGPPLMIADFKVALLEKAVDETRILIDDWE